MIRLDGAVEISVQLGLADAIADVVDSGRTLALVLDLLTNVGAQPRSAVVYAKPTTVVEPDYVWARTDKWIVFPWSAEPPVTAS